MTIKSKETALRHSLGALLCYTLNIIIATEMCSLLLDGMKFLKEASHSKGARTLIYQMTYRKTGKVSFI